MADAPSSPGLPHSTLVKFLVVVGAVLAVIACFATWAERQALTTDDWVNTSGRLLEDEAIQKALANYAVDELYANVDVSGELERELPPDFKQLSGPAATGLRQLAVQGAERALTTDRFQQIWKNANRAAHETLLDVIENRGEVASTENGEVTLELRPLITETAGQLGIGTNLVDKLPPDVGRLTILKSDQLSLAQTVAKLVRGIALIASLLALAIFALAIYLSRGYRWVTVLAVGIAFIGVGIVVLVLREVAGNVVVDSLATESSKEAAESAWSIGTSLLSSIAKSLIVFGIFFVIAAWLASPHRSSVATRRTLTPVLRDYPVAVFALLAVVALIWLLSGVDSTRAILTRLILIAFAGYGLFELRRICIAEFPDATMADLWGRTKARAAAMRHGAAPAARRPEPDDMRLERLERLGALHERGLLSDDEFTAEKSKVLAASAPTQSGSGPA